MSFLKQLLKPFVEFDADNPQGQQPPPAAPQVGTPPKQPSATSAPPAPAKPPTQAGPPVQAKTPATLPKAAPPTPPKQPAPAQPQVRHQPVHHPLLDGATVDVTDQVPTYSPSGTLVQPLPEHVRYFETLIDNANRSNPLFQGADYKEFVDSKLDIDDIKDEVLKYQTAYAVLKSTGLTRDKLLSTGQEYIQLIGRDMNVFQGAYALKYQQELGQKEAMMKKRAAELQALIQQMNALKAEINSLTQDINLAKEKLQITKASFLLAGENKQQEIDTELEKIARYF